MICSMTGFGRGYASVEGREITLEMKSVNHKFLDIAFRLPKSLGFLEETLRSVVSKKLSRGHVDIVVLYRNMRDDAKEIVPDTGVMQKYIALAKNLSEEYGVHNDITATSLIRLPEAITVLEGKDNPEAIIELCEQAAEMALIPLCEMRKKEGINIAADLQKKLDGIKRLRELMVQRAPTVTQQYEARLREKAAAWNNDFAVDMGRVATEIALFADKSCVDEELVRIKSHISEFSNMLNMDTPIGRSLDFLTQELLREFNTIGSKASDGELTKFVIAGKTEVEKLREQVQNIE